MLQNVTFVLSDFLVFQSGMSFSLIPSGQPSQQSSCRFRMAKESPAFCKGGSTTGTVTVLGLRQPPLERGKAELLKTCQSPGLVS